MDFRCEYMKDLVADRLRVNVLFRKVASWVASAVARRVELPEDLAARVAVLAFGNELLDLVLPGDTRLRQRPGGRMFVSFCQWEQPSGRIFAATYLLPRAETALRQELQRLAAAAKRARLGQSSSSSGSREI
jgi:hypothetical protein